MSANPAQAKTREDRIEELRAWLEGVEELPYLEDGDRKKAKRILEAEGMSLDRVERGGIRYALRKVFEILGESVE
jgi:hypothetical protein